MKKITFALLALGSISTASANGVFEGWSFGAELNTTKHAFSVSNAAISAGQTGKFTAKGSHKTGVAVVGGYGFALGQSDFVGQVEGKIRTAESHTRAQNARISKEKWGASVAYAQGYRLSNVMPYVKVSLNSSAFSTNQDALCGTRCTIGNHAARGIGVGGGVKYAVNPQVELGADYHRTYLKGRNSIKIKTETVGVNAAYRF